MVTILVVPWVLLTSKLEEQLEWSPCNWQISHLPMASGVMENALPVTQSMSSGPRLWSASISPLPLLTFLKNAS